ncbi:5-dehydro-4-deoxyglucarate dehydratase [Ruania alba]|uniref:Probable 5-dehydro-4-deoxyglucarate dehydratase n=1 Tax=Ruania alba TaxID=648782 RepID=A0A1H5N1G4_9MICO|nr:5-dehydro-4-deoxyglucarate dehydratase [Ruania alba]SEE95280.1 5-dehydro-4-deoxyglucarate dehydratase [Ruania alba]
MPTMDPRELAERLGGGLLSFPVTPFDAALDLDEHAYRDHLRWLAEYPVAGLFAAGGTGELFSLSPAEVARVVRLAVAEIRGRVPVLAPASASTALAVEQAADAERAGADGVLLFPPYLTEASADGLRAHVQAVCAATNLGVVYYNRANGRIDATTLARLAQDCPNLVGFKDGTGDIELVTRVHVRLGDRLTLIGGLPTAETCALAFAELGVATYSSAMFNFAPEFALGFHDAVRRRDRTGVDQRLREFVLPYLDIRDRRPGYAVSIIKAALAAAGRPSSRVRPPLTDLTVEEVELLTPLVAHVTTSSWMPTTASNSSDTAQARQTPG